MGAYIDPASESKENWLRNNAEVTSKPKSFDEKPGFLPVCLVNNGIFTAAGICFNSGELEAFSDPRDVRQKTWFWADKEKLMDPKVSSLHYYLKDDK